jgi:hypothetical protein
MADQRVFISYKREDVEFAKKLREFILNQGFDAWMDIFNIPKGVDPDHNIIGWDDAIDKGLRNSDVVLGVMTPESVASPNVLNEWGWSLSNKRPFILVRLRDVHNQDIPHRYIRVNYIDFVGSDDIGFKLLAERLKSPHQDVYPELEQDENRENFLSNFENAWIKSWLGKYAEDKRIIDLALSLRNELVQSPWEDLQGMGRKLPSRLLMRSAITEVFRELNQSMLILGAPGSGKTLTLLQLAWDYIKLARGSSEYALPAYFNLSTWAQTQQPLEVWLIQELYHRYEIPQEVAQIWVGQVDLLFLLDGLDEVPERLRDDCVRAINKFRDKCRNAAVVVCCRTNEYIELSEKERLQLSGAIEVQPLTEEQIKEYLTAAEGDTDVQMQAVQENSTLWELAHKPLMLEIMAVVFGEKGVQVEAGEQVNESERTTQLYNAYITRVFQRLARSKSEEFSKEDSLKWLGWLARKMLHTQTEFFLVEELSPEWLDSKREVLLYKLLSTLGLALTWGIPTGLAFSFALATPTYLSFSDTWMAGMTFGLGVAIVAGLIFQLIPMKLWGRLLLTAGVGAVTGLSAGMMWGLDSALFGGLLVGALFFALSFSKSITRQSNEVVISDRLTISYARGLLGLGMSLLIVLLTRGNLAGRIALGATVAIPLVLTGATRSTKVPPTERKQPNEGMRRTARVAGIFGGVTGVSLTLIILLTTRLEFARIGFLRFGEAIDALAIGIGVGVGIWVFFGGFSLIKHAVLRLMLWRKYGLPLKLVRFLDFASDQILLQQVGGGYAFIHRTLMEHFANHELAVGEQLSRVLP